ncbi:MAG: NAD-dependent epimerase/dehydratase family protein [Bacteroidetes bacterium]|jgi:nucleoside-diphosphate-sugar epimerase|nr:NAD-dependent epimerase/dehydratase family protein [Bacteroidota bacterium]
MSQKIFITGVTASLMKGLLFRLREEGHQIIGLSRQDTLLSGITVIKGDLQDPSAWQQEVLTCDMIIHGAAVTHSHKESDYFKVNLEATKTLLSLCRPEQGFVFLSSRTAGPDSGAYGRSKWEAENHIRSHHERHLILSPSEVFGVAKGEGIEKLITNAMTKSFLAYPRGVRYPMRPIHVDDLCEVMHRLITNETWPEGPVIINGPESMGFLRFFELISEASGHRPLLIPIPESLMRTLSSVAKWVPGALPFTSDQVTRLYAPKKEDEMASGLTRLSDYVKSISHSG